MPYSVLSFEPTPNPDALRCVLDGVPAPAPAGKQPRAYEAPGPTPEEDKLASALCAVAGMKRILIHSNWVTISREPQAPWAPIKAAVRRVLADAGG